MAGSGGLTDLSILQRVIDRRKLPLKIGRPTPAVGNCFIEAFKQNLEHFSSKGLIPAELVPKDVNTIRQDTVKYMTENKNFFVGDNGIPGPMNEETFLSLIEDQSRDNAYTDLNGMFILSCCKLYNIELSIIQTDIHTPILDSGIGGPVVLINQSQDDEERVRFYMGLIKLDDPNTGHFQFVYPSESRIEDENSVTSSYLTLTSPVKLGRSRIVRNYLKTPSPKKWPNDSQTHCLAACGSNYSTPFELECHLLASARCSQRYIQSLRIKDLSAHLLTLNFCFFCKFTTQKFKISIHLKKNVQCLNKYFTKFGVKSVKEVLKNIEKAKKKMHESRSRAHRRLETQKRRERKINQDPKRTTTDLVNEFRRETALTNVRHCIKCHANLSDARAEEIKKGSPILTEDLSEKLESRRFQRFYICSGCKEQKNVSGDSTPNIKGRKMEISGHLVWTPKLRGHGQIQQDEDSQEGVVTKCLFPCNVQSLDNFSQIKIKSHFNESQTSLYKLGPISNESFSRMYENELYKYFRARSFGDKFTGEIKDVESRLLSSTERIIMDHVIVGSDSFLQVERRNKIHKLEHFGSIFLSFTVTMPLSLDVIASSIIQTGIVVTVEFKAQGNGEFQTHYLVHNHRAETDCDPSCQTETLQSFLMSNTDFEEDQVKKNHVMTYISNVQMKMNSFARNFLKDPVSPLFSEDFSLELKFELDGSIKIVGSVWPKLLEELNKSFSSYPHKDVGNDQKEKSVEYVDSIITASTDPEVFKELFAMSASESAQFSLLAQSHQFHFCRNDECPKCEKPSLPSLETLFKEMPGPEDLLNIETANQLCEIVLSKLNSVTEDEVNTLSSEAWLQTIFPPAVLEMISDDILRIKFDGVTLDFIIDERLKLMMSKFPNPAVAAYHYSISSGEVSASFSCIIKRPKIKDCYTKSYNIALLKAFNAPMTLMVVNGHDKRRTIEENPISLNLNDEILDFETSHNLISVVEAVTLFDKNVSRTKSSTVVEFVNAVRDRRLYFKKVPNETESTFKVESSCDFFEKTNSNIERYIGRQNGASLTLMEFVTFYDYTGIEESRQLMKLFSSQNVDIQSSEIKCASNEKEFLPEIIITNSGDVMKLRSSRKVVAYPCYEDNPSKYKFTKVLLFYPLREIPHDEQVVSTMSQEIDEAGKVIIDRNER